MLFQGRYENGYDIFTDSDYINWLPDALPENLCESGEVHLPSLQTCSSSTTLHDDLHASTVYSKYTVEQLLQFENAFDNGNDACLGEDYLEWLCEIHPGGLLELEKLVVKIVAHLLTQQSLHPSTFVETQGVPISSSPKSPRLCISSAISEFLITLPVGKIQSTTKSKVSTRSNFGARVLTSAESRKRQKRSRSRKVSLKYSSV